MLIISSEYVIRELSNGQVTSTDLFLKENTPDPNGLFSNEIFGNNPKDRKTLFGHIELNCRVFHPHILRVFKDAYRKEYQLAYELKPYIFDPTKQEFIEIKEEDIKNYKQEDLLYGFYGIIVNLHKLKKKDSKNAQLFWNLFEKYGIESCLIQVIPVIPIFYRDYKNMYQYDQINDVYLSILQSSDYISKLTPGNNLKYCRAINYMQRYVYNLYEYIQNKTGKKTGIMRQFLLGKRVDFSGRSVITVDPKLKPNEIGIPFRMAVNLFEPWILRRLVHDENIPVPDAIELLQKISKGYTHGVTEDLRNKVLQITEEVTKDRYVLTKRDPNLHRVSIRSFKCRIVHDNSIHLSPLIVSGFNADFDGDSIDCKVILKISKKDKLSKPTLNPPTTFQTNVEQKYRMGTYDIVKLKDASIKF